MTNLAFEVIERESNEKSNLLRKNGQVPCIIYGGSLEKAIPIKIKKIELIKLISSNTSSSLIPLKINGKTKTCVIKEVQKDVYGKVIHADFQAVRKNEVIRLKIPVTFLGEENLETKRLVLETFSPEIEVQGVASSMPETLEFDVSNMNFEDKVLASNITLPKGISLITDSEILLAIAASSNNNSEEEDE
ncbi:MULTISPECIES: 50S ribosomal protein L25 [Clostridium]|uniref:Large ribosomal subunit protein bL25 n=1 Tax=Clostridium cibarium TaxID=2762247 RepID=A0ABR8PRV0_9CLOT|nr:MULTISPECIES: 50S ribosomal protein L25 [Clostridium]MBD7910905.1 50S ribosomal protein L25 [Clostridium cibarium]